MSSWAVPFIVQIVVGALVIVVVLSGRPEFFGAEECIWFLGATLITAVVAATIGQLSDYGAIGFAAATVTILAVSLAAWISVTHVHLTVYFLALILADLVAAIILARCTGKLRQAGRGMLVGLVAVPLSPALMWIAALAAMAR
ncbi:hypothetical protein [Mycolicibacterium sp. YH-1]|uniref:hypothetical protein n=1 Tax=Mycolicibacterium sp. YH-1 TaxID=2908837 RepID=UPI001F4C2070|nr:hypothetical protein [Mycolicibacterium sp. YH-1]UNB55810.1 hypothetical protein L0M16_16705 [Mycolicibacterium sp. YH-1]